MSAKSTEETKKFQIEAHEKKRLTSSFVNQNISNFSPQNSR